MSRIKAGLVRKKYMRKNDHLGVLWRTTALGEEQLSLAEGSVELVRVRTFSKQIL